MESRRTELNEFLAHLNSQNRRIQLTMELDDDGEIAVSDVLVENQSSENLGHRVYGKPTGTDRCLNRNYSHQSKGKRDVPKTLIDPVITISESIHQR